MNAKHKNGFSNGLTLIEVMIVIAIIGILASVAIPSYTGYLKRAARTEAYSNLESLRLLEEQFFAENGGYTQSADDVAAIQALLPGFQPGTGLSFSYQIVQNRRIDTPITSPPTWTAVQTPCFTAVATGIAGSRVAGDIFTIDCNNNKNF
ncbi:MAG: prepilin-type N-terminal cleavage/methylation domain-containing protein [Thermodesulfovibrionales bacterium]|nr:prepilin-type N-terminal cleavage/methylation domain-containing protein [Thermodesulfovibrionales bacterium]